MTHEQRIEAYERQSNRVYFTPKQIKRMYKKLGRFNKRVNVTPF